MSFTVVEEAQPRLNRSEQTVPGSNARFIEKAAQGNADTVFLDLEDSVAPSEKEKARGQVVQALNDLDWSGKTVSVRVNAFDTPYTYRDVMEVLEAAGDRIDLIMLPKVGTASDVYALDVLVTQVMQNAGKQDRIGFELLLESALGMQNIHELAAASKRNESLHFGVADYAASTGMRTTQIGGPNPDYAVLTDPDADGNREVHWGDMWHYAITRMVVAARANGLRPVDGPFGAFKDSEGYKAQARRAAVLGCEGKWCIHPSQVELANEVFSPSQEAVDNARRILEALDEAHREGYGAVTLDNKLIDNASIKQAKVLVRKAEQIGQG